MDVFRLNAPKAHPPGSNFVIGSKRMLNQEKFADCSDNSGAPKPPEEGKQPAATAPPR
jgi:hypothetical protein